MISSWIAFLAWVPISLYFFRRYPVRIAVLINFIGGWAVLPSAAFSPTNAIFPYWIPRNLSAVYPLLHQGEHNSDHLPGGRFSHGPPDLSTIQAQLLGPSHAGLVLRSPIFRTGQ